jgi:molybdopterin-containing oxidoreductase family iron-sulfur binding subunit
MAHYLESWGDVRAYDGTASLVQPLIAPLYQGKTATEVLAAMLNEEKSAAHDIVQAYWKTVRGSDNFKDFWRVALGKGIVEAGTPDRVSPSVKNEYPAQAYTAKEGGLDIVFRPDPSVLDGSFTNNGWLQELPRPLTKLTWDNAIFINPRTAEQLHLKHEDWVKLAVNGQEVEGPVYTQVGHPRDVVTVHLGYGQERVGRVGNTRGFNAYAVQTMDHRWFTTGATLTKTNDRYSLARTEEHWNIEQSLMEQGQKAEDRHLIREAAVGYYAEHPDFAQHMGHHTPDRDFTLYNPDEKPFQTGWGNQWGMTIDLNRCTGCNVCTIACQAENNIPIVGKEEVIMGREMHWIRVDRYYKGDGDEPGVAHQPIPCMQCENAPCEPVCPVGATMHSAEGLNDMVYNRCVGTRYCSNNCPYKVRRFNFFHYQIREGQDAQTLKMMRNPNVTVRSRGVMEKCTYCVQRINAARIEAKREGNRPIADGEVVVACQQACPSNAISFGSLTDESSEVAKKKASGRNYGLIADIGTRPRTSYLAKLRNPSPVLEPDAAAGGDAHGGGH